MTRIKRFSLAAMVMAGVLVVGGCGSGGSTPAPGEEVKSNHDRITTPQASADDVKALVAGNNAFAFDMYQSLVTGNGDNTFFSPYSISVALAMTFAGAKNQTEQEMAKALRFDLAQAQLHPAFDFVDLALGSRGQGAKASDGKAFRLHVVNSIFGQTGYSFVGAFLDVLAEYYGAGMRLLDFAKDPEGGRKLINDWVAEVTEQRIKDLIPQGDIDILTRLVLVNAIYFNAAWASPFDEKLTQDGDFHKLDGTTVKASMMLQDVPCRSAQGDNFAAIELPYDGNQLSMVVLVPEAGEFAAFEGALDENKLAQILGAMEDGEVTLTMPKWKFEGGSISLKDVLSALGMPDAFVDGVADFSGMDGTLNLFIGNVIHKAFVSVNEAGTEAAAATAVIMEGSGMPLMSLTVDRPFIYLVRDIETGQVLFLGRVLDPSL